MKSHLPVCERLAHRSRRDDVQRNRTRNRAFGALALTGLLLLTEGRAALADGCRVVGVGCRETPIDASVEMPGVVADSSPNHATGVATAGTDNAEQAQRVGTSSEPDPPGSRNHPGMNRPPSHNSVRAHTGSRPKGAADKGGGVHRTLPNETPSAGHQRSGSPGYAHAIPAAMSSPQPIRPPNTARLREPPAKQTIVPPPPAIRAPSDAAPHDAIAGIADALRFPTVLLALLFLFLALQARADRRDPKLAQAPIGGRQDWLEFR